MPAHETSLTFISEVWNLQTAFFFFLLRYKCEDCSPWKFLHAHYVTDFSNWLLGAKVFDQAWHEWEERTAKPQFLWYPPLSMRKSTGERSDRSSFRTRLTFTWQCQLKPLHLLLRAHSHGHNVWFRNLSGEIPISRHKSYYALDATSPGDCINEQIRSISIRPTWNNCLFVTINFRALTQDPMILILNVFIIAWNPAH